MKSCLTRFCPANHQMNCMVMVITEDSGFNYRYPVRGRKLEHSRIYGFVSKDLITVTP